MLTLLLSTLALQCSLPFRAALDKALAVEGASQLEIIELRCDTRAIDAVSRDGVRALVRWLRQGECSTAEACPAEARLVAMLIVEATRAQPSRKTAPLESEAAVSAPPPHVIEKTTEPPPPPVPLGEPARWRLQASVGISALPMPRNTNWFPEHSAVSAGAVLSNGSATPSGHPFSAAHPLAELDCLYRLTERRLVLQGGVSFGWMTALRDDRVSFGANGFAQGGVAMRLGGHLGLRVLMLTDRWRPYALGGLRLDGFIYTTNLNAIMPAAWKVMPGAYAGLGLEVAISRVWSVSADVRYSALVPVGYAVLSQLDARVAFISAL